MFHESMAGATVGILPGIPPKSRSAPSERLIDPGLMRTGSFLAFNIAFANLAAAVLAVGYTSIGLVELLPMYERIKPILEERPEFAAAVIEPIRLAGALALNQVSFRYPGQDQGTSGLAALAAVMLLGHHLDQERLAELADVADVVDA